MPCSSALLTTALGFPGGSDGEESACTAGEQGAIPGCEGPLEKGMAPHFSILAWRFPGTEDLVGSSPWSCEEWDTTERLILSNLGFPALLPSASAPSG